LRVQGVGFRVKGVSPSGGEGAGFRFVLRVRVEG
jgi:hypothetical protein